MNAQGWDVSCSTVSAAQGDYAAAAKASSAMYEDFH